MSSVLPIDFEVPDVQVPDDPDTQVAALDTEGQSALSPDQQDDVTTNVQSRDGGNDITIWRYPIELGTDVQYPHFVMFYVNARAGTAVADKRGRRDANNQLLQQDQTDQMRLDPNNNVQEGTAVGALAGASAGASLGTKFLSDAVLASAPASVKVIVGALGGAVTGAAGAVVGAGIGAGYAALNKRPLIKIKDVIALHVNTPPSASYKAQWTESDMGAAWGAAGADIGDLTMKTGLDAGDILLRSLAAKAPKAIGGPNLKDALESLSRKVANPFKEQLFKSMGMRTFAFDYTFLPKNPQEARNVLNILRTFKRHMHPEIDNGKLFLVYPSEFNIVYYYRDKENPYVNKISSCVLTDMNVRFGDGKDFTTFVGGFPTLVEIRLQFLELEMLTAGRVDKDLDLSGTDYGF